MTAAAAAAAGTASAADAASAQVVERFLQACGARDLDAALAMVTDDIVYDNVPVGPVHGPEGVRSVLAGGVTQAADEVDWQVLHLVAADDIVMSERVDRFRRGERWLEIPVAGVFELRAGRIAAWRDYFDLESYRRQKREIFG